MQIQGLQKDLLPGDPVCAPAMAVMSEAYITLIKNLHSRGAWTDIINDKITAQLDKVKDMDALKKEEISLNEDGGKEKKEKSDKGDDAGTVKPV